MSEQRDEQHVEVHGDGDVAVNPGGEQSAPEPEPQTGDTSADAAESESE